MPIISRKLFCPSPDRSNFVLLRLTKFINLLCAGNAPPAVTPHLCGASLFPCKKKDGGLCPIAVGEVLRCLTSKCIAKAVQSEAFRVITPLQVGVSGCEAIVHAVADVLNDSARELLVDYFNAFNSIDHGSMRARIPSMAAWFDNYYGSEPVLCIGHHSLLRCCGVQQGDRLGPLGFAFALHEKIKRKVPGFLSMPGTWMMVVSTICHLPLPSLRPRPCPRSPPEQI